MFIKTELLKQIKKRGNYYHRDDLEPLVQETFNEFPELKEVAHSVRKGYGRFHIQSNVINYLRENFPGVGYVHFKTIHWKGNNNATHPWKRWIES